MRLYKLISSFFSLRNRTSSETKSLKPATSKNFPNESPFILALLRCLEIKLFPKGKGLPPEFMRSNSTVAFVERNLYAMREQNIQLSFKDPEILKRFLAVLKINDEYSTHDYSVGLLFPKELIDDDLRQWAKHCVQSEELGIGSNKFADGLCFGPLKEEITKVYDPNSKCFSEVIDGKFKEALDLDDTE